jgi:hypothetical protein
LNTKCKGKQFILEKRKAFLEKEIFATIANYLGLEVEKNNVYKIHKKII